MSSARYIVGDSLTVLRTLPDASVDLVLTSPPFLALRSYLPADHPDKGREMGSEATPGAFIDALLDIVEECARVLTPHGSLCFELGDTYSGSGGAGGDYNVGGLRDGQEAFDGSAKRRRKVNGHAVRDDAPRPSRSGWHRSGAEDPDRYRSLGAIDGGSVNSGPGWPLPKSLCLIPESFRWALVYGRNPFTGRETPRWRARNVVRWHRPNPPVGALGDKFRPATSDMVIACKSRTRYFDLDAVRTEAIDQRVRFTNGPKARDADSAEVQTGNYTERVPSNPAGAPPLDTWIIPTEPYKGSHYATFPTALLTRPIKAMCPEKVCVTCGEPSRRITKAAEGYADHLGESWADRSEGRDKADGRERNSHSGQPAGGHIVAAAYDTVGWTTCGHDTWRAGVCLDPFAGSGTTLEVATGHGRDAIGIDLDARNAELAYQRVGMFLTVEHP